MSKDADVDRLTCKEIEMLIDDLIVAHPIYTPQLRALREQSLPQEAVRDEALEGLLRRWIEAPMREGSWDYIELKGETERALKREPNAAEGEDNGKT